MGMRSAENRAIGDGKSLATRGICSSSQFLDLTRSTLAGVNPWPSATVTPRSSNLQFVHVPSGPPDATPAIQLRTSPSCQRTASRGTTGHGGTSRDRSSLLLLSRALWHSGRGPQPRWSSASRPVRPQVRLFQVRPPVAVTRLFGLEIPLPPSVLGNELSDFRLNEASVRNGRTTDGPSSQRFHASNAEHDPPDDTPSRRCR